MQAVLLIDFGSTYTKVTIVDLDQGGDRRDGPSRYDH